MQAEILGKGTGISALLLSLGILFTLTEKDVFSSAEAIDAVDIALDTLKKVTSTDDPEDDAAIRSAGRILESVRSQF